MIKPLIELEDDAAEITADSIEVSEEYFDDCERKVFADIRKIEQSNMKFPERKFYLSVVEFLWNQTRFYENNESASDLLWKNH